MRCYIFRFVDPKSAVYEIQNLPDAIEKLTQTNLRNLVGQLDLDESLVSRDKTIMSLELFWMKLPINGV